MYQFKRAEVLPVFLKRRITIRQLAQEAGVSDRTAWKAVSGESVSAAVVDRIAVALGVNPLDVVVETRTIADGATRRREVR